MNIFFIGDTHFSEDHIRRYESRPFKDVYEMDEQLILRWNNKIRTDDKVYVLGNFGAIKRESDILTRLNGSKFLIKGYDTYSNEYYRNAGFEEVYDYPIILHNYWMLSHGSLYTNENMPYVNIFGYIHKASTIKTYSKQYYCVSVDRINYTPISLNEIIDRVINENTNV